MSGLYLCIHGHFYQPPRENPWTGEIEKQPSAAPFHNWNERIYQECYKPNSEAVIVDDTGKVLKRVNNYEYLNFNFGPTLIDWINKKHPKTLSRIIEADRLSMKAHGGHGNAIAQVYNHIIMPLALTREMITQVKWGVRHFEHYFSRVPEGIWLAETACSNSVLEVLINEGMKYTILDPSQAGRIRSTEGGNWIDVRGAKINPKVPYRYFSKAKPDENRYIDIFFYDGPLSKSSAFDDVIFDAGRMMDRIDGIKSLNYAGPQLISLAVDGETFGHHKHFTERTIAYLLSELAEKRGYRVVNFGEYLSLKKPESEVEIYEGDKGEGTSWSCIHGVSRWKEDCGCHTGGGTGWNQRWRKPLRESLNNLNSKISAIFELEGSRYFRDVWEARNDYIGVMLEISPVKDFIKKHQVKKLSRRETDYCLGLLEMEKYSMLMFTSCGWFFSDISGIETVKVLEYAKRAVDIGEKLTGASLEADFCEELARARSNIPEFGSGCDIYRAISEGSDA